MSLILSIGLLDLFCNDFYIYCFINCNTTHNMFYNLIIMLKKKKDIIKIAQDILSCTLQILPLHSFHNKESIQSGKYS